MDVSGSSHRSLAQGKEDAKLKNEQMVGSRLPRDLVRDLEFIEKSEQTDRSTTVRKLLFRAVEDWKREHFARLYGERRVTLARAAEDAGVSLWDMMDYVQQKRIGAQYDLQDLEHDLRELGATQLGGTQAAPRTRKARRKAR